jgi:DNA-binding MarR family transcriptional regulator
VAADAQISKQAVNDLLRHLEQRGYLRRHPDPADSRARIIRLTPRGKRLHRMAVGIHARVEDEWAEEVGATEFGAPRATLARLAQLPD